MGHSVIFLRQSPMWKYCEDRRQQCGYASDVLPDPSSWKEDSAGTQVLVLQRKRLVGRMTLA